MQFIPTKDKTSILTKLKLRTNLDHSSGHSTSITLGSEELICKNVMLILATRNTSLHNGLYLRHLFCILRLQAATSKNNIMTTTTTNVIRIGTAALLQIIHSVVSRLYPSIQRLHMGPLVPSMHPS